MISFYDNSVGVHLRALKVLTHLLEKAKAHATAKNISLDEVVEWRLIEDMKPLSFQVQTVCNASKNFLKFGVHLEMPAVEDNEKTLADLQARIASTVKLLQGVDPASFEGKEDKLAMLPAAFKSYGDLTGSQYLLGFTNPNVYFHLVTTYDILRSKGVDIGKRDYLRPDSAAWWLMKTFVKAFQACVGIKCIYSEPKLYQTSHGVLILCVVTMVMGGRVPFLDFARMYSNKAITQAKPTKCEVELEGTSK